MYFQEKLNIYKLKERNVLFPQHFYDGLQNSHFTFTAYIKCETNFKTSQPKAFYSVQVA